MRVSRNQLTPSFERFFDFSVDLLCIANFDGFLVRVNRAMTEVFGFSEEELLKRSMMSLIHPDDLEKTVIEGEKLKQGMTSTFFENRCLMHDGRIKVMAWAIRTDGEFIYAVGRESVRSESEAKLLASERAAIEASQLKSDFLANMSHEIRTPLNGLIGMIDLLLDSKLDQEQREYVKMVHQSSKLLFGVLNDILDFSKIESGKLELESIRFDPNTVLGEIESTLKHMADLKQIKLRIERLPSETIAYGDAQRLRQVLFNLLHNAIKFTSNGSVSLETEVVLKKDQKILLRFKVKDTGVGMSPQYLRNLFSPFTQADSSTTRKFGGTGLGLSICKKLLDLMGSQFTVTSEKGVGTEFSFQVWLGEAEKIRLVPRAPKKIPVVKPRKILVAEDHEANQILIKRILMKSNHAVTLVKSGIEAVEACRKNVFDLVLMDCHMPEMDGFEASYLIRQDPGSLNQKTPIFAVTADVVKGVKERCIQSGMTGYLSKPLSIEKLNRVVAGTRSRTSLFSLETIKKLEVLNEDGLSDVCSDLVESFLSRFELRLKNIESSFQAKDLELAQKEAHALKGAALSVGAIKVGTISSKIENLARARNAEEIEKQMKRLRIAARHTEPVLRAFIESRKP